VDLVAVAEHKNPRKPPRGANLLDKMLKESCPYHQVPVKHTLEECAMLRWHFHKAGPPAEGGKALDDAKEEDHKAGGFPEVRDSFMIYGGQVANASARHRKQKRREVCSVKVAAPVYLDWSDKPITFDRADHPDYVPSPGRYPLVVDPIIGNVRLTKVLIDGGSSLNIIYADVTPLVLRVTKTWHVIIRISIILFDTPKMHFTRFKTYVVCCLDESHRSLKTLFVTKFKYTTSKLMTLSVWALSTKLNLSLWSRFTLK
jgi:hypothetical protein